MNLKPIAWLQFTDCKCPVYEDPDGRQFVYDHEGERVYGVWYIPPNECDVLNIVNASLDTARPD